MPNPQDAYQVVNMAGQVLAIFTQAGDAEAWLKARNARLEQRTGLWIEVDDDGDVDAIQELLLRLSRLVEEVPEIVELDLNPIFALPPGQGYRIVDARIRVGRSVARWNG
jgi:hypothetical protein